MFIDISNAQTLVDDIAGGHSKSASANHNTVRITNGSFDSLYGGDGANEASHNCVVISGGSFASMLYGGYAAIKLITGTGLVPSKANNNMIIISGCSSAYYATIKHLQP